MTIASEFIAMAKEMLDDPEIGCDGTIYKRTVVTPDPLKPHLTTSVETPFPLRLFYTDDKNKLVNGSVIKQGEKVAIAYEPEGLALDSTQTYKFVDHRGVTGVINAVEAITAGNETVVVYLKIGS